MKHMTAWTALNKGYTEANASGRSFGVGVWHEIYQVCRFGYRAFDAANTLVLPLLELMLQATKCLHHNNNAGRCIAEL